MRVLVSLAVVLVVLATVGLLAKKQLSALRAPAAVAPSASTPANPVPLPQTPQHIQRQVQELLQQPRPMPDDGSH